MKVQGYIVLALGMVLATNAEANICARFFSLQGVPENSISKSSDTKILNEYLKLASEISKKSFEPKPGQSAEVLSNSKINFLKKHQVGIQKLISTGDVSLEQIVKAKVFLAEIVNNGLAKPHSYMLIIDRKIYSFPLKASENYEVIGESKLGFTQASLLNFYRLGKEVAILVKNDRSFIFPRQNKDPAYLDEVAKAGKLEPHLAELYKTHKDEIQEILTHTTTTIEALATGKVLKGKSEKGEAVTLLSIAAMDSNGNKANKVIYFTEKPRVIEAQNKKRWGEVSFAEHFGYGVNPKFKFKNEEDGMIIVIEDGVMKLSQESISTNAFLTLNNITATAETSKFRSDFVKEYGDAIKKLIQERAFKESDFNEVIAGLDVAYNSRSEPLYILPSKKGDLYFGYNEKEMGRLADVNVAKYGNTFYTASGEKIVLGRSVGFFSENVAKRIETDDMAANDGAFVAKIQIGLNSFKLTQPQMDALFQLSKNLRRMKREMGPAAEYIMGAVQKLPQEELKSLTKLVKEDLTKDKVFTEKEADEIIKMLFILDTGSKT